MSHPLRLLERWVGEADDGGLARPRAMTLVTCERLEELGVSCRGTVVDRLCPDSRVEGGRLVVRADPQAE